ncbi:MAG: hypothetical protein IJQ00_02045, partial [Kiritimatiellae bacterium]|nr:hypothetical protein [Kiritimatiellia bacterium]
GLGPVFMESGLTVDLNGNSLTVAALDGDFVSTVFTNTSETASTLYTYTGTVGTGVLTENITVRAPDGFVEYVEAADGQYFDTGVIGKPGTKFQTKFMLAPKSEANKALIGSSGNSADFWLKFDYDACLNNKFGSWYAYTWLTADVVYETRCECTAGNKVVIVLDDADGVNKINWNATSTMSNTGKSMYYFARNNNGTANGLCPGRCYGLTIWQVPDGGTDYVLVRNFIPCVRDGRPGLYDAVSHEMFYSLADGDFTPGPAVTPVELTHRWSFTSDYSDSVGTADAENPVGSGVSVSDGRAVLAGGDNAGYLDLGEGVLGSGDATLEMWFEKLGSPASWAYAFSYAADGSSSDNMFALSTAWGWNSNSDNGTGVSIVPVYMNIGGTWYGTTSSGASTTYTLAYLLPNLPQHISVTFKTNSDGSTTVRWMSRDAATGFLLKECSNTIPSWTLADASAFRLLLGRNPYGWSTVHTLNSQFDEVRVWNGVLTDEQLSANVLAGPDATFTDGIVAGFDGMVVTPGEMFEVNGKTGGYGYWTDKCVTLRTGAKIRFNTTDYFGTGLRFRAGGFVLPVGETDLLSFVELDDAENYTVSLEDANTILVQLKDAIPHTSTWTGATPSSAADLSNAANWTSVNAKGATVTAAPTAKTTAVIPAENLATFTLPGGVSANWGRVLLGGYTKTQWGRIASTGGNNIDIGFRDRPVSDYTAGGEKDVSYLNRTSGNLPAELGGSQLRFDGWINVSAAQAGRWDIRCNMDDMIAFAVDGEWQFMHNTWRFGITAGCYVSEGWHRFTLIVRDTGGGYGVSTSLNGTLYPFVLSVNGGAEIGFSDLTFGTGSTSVALSGDANWAGLGPVFMESGLTVDLNGNSLTVAALDGDFVSTVFTNTSETASTLYT